MNQIPPYQDLAKDRSNAELVKIDQIKNNLKMLRSKKRNVMEGSFNHSEKPKNSLGDGRTNLFGSAELNVNSGLPL